MSYSTWFDPYGSCPSAGRPQRVRKQVRRFKTLRRRQDRYEGKRLIRMEQMALFEWEADDARPEPPPPPPRAKPVEQLTLF